MKISTNVLNKISYIYLSIPLLIFLLSWLNPIFAIISGVSVVVVLKILFSDSKPKKSIVFNKQMFLFTLFAALIWCYLAGIGNIHYQSPDWHLRNAVFRDLIDFPYPVKYDNGAILIYYFGIMLPAALFGKVLALFNIDSVSTFKIANLFNLLYCSTGVALCFLHSILLTNSKNFKKVAACILIFIFFSGLDIVFPGNNIKYLHIEWHFIFFHYSSHTTQLFWVYNQAIMSWLICLVFLSNPYKISNFAYLGTLNLFYAPFCFIGMLFFYLGIFARKLIQAIKFKKFKPILYKTFSISNLLPLLFILPCVYLYYKLNPFITDPKPNFFPLEWYTLYFIFFEAGIFLYLIKNKYKTNLIYYITLLSLFFIPLIRFINIADYIMRASIPALTVLIILIVKFLFSKEYKVQRVILIICLLIGAITPGLEFFRGFYLPYKHNIPREKDSFVTLNNKITDNCLITKIGKEGFIINETNFCNYGTVKYKKNILFKY